MPGSSLAPMSHILFIRGRCLRLESMGIPGQIQWTQWHLEAAKKRSVLISLSEPAEVMRDKLTQLFLSDFDMAKAALQGRNEVDDEFILSLSQEEIAQVVQTQDVLNGTFDVLKGRVSWPEILQDSETLDNPEES